MSLSDVEELTPFVRKPLSETKPTDKTPNEQQKPYRALPINRTTSQDKKKYVTTKLSDPKGNSKREKQLAVPTRSSQRTKSLQKGLNP